MPIFPTRTFKNVIFDLKQSADMFPIAIKNFSVISLSTILSATVEKDVVLCPAGQQLPPSRGAIRKLSHYSYKTYHTTKAVCSACAIRSQCLKSEKSKWRNYQVLVDSDKPNVIQKMIDKIDSPKGREVYTKRMGIVEPVFANIRTHKRLDKFTLRGQEKVNIQWFLYCIVHNLSKITNYGAELAMV